MRRFRTPALAAALVLLGATATEAQHGAHAPAAGYVCGPQPAVTDTFVPLWTNVWNTVSVPITRHPVAYPDSVQAYFNQGVAWMYGYNFGEAVLSFRKAAFFDPKCAMCFWGVATALGSNINEPIIMRRWAMASAYVDTAMRAMNTAPASGAERDYILAAQLRFQPFYRDTIGVKPADFRATRARMDRLYYQALQVMWWKSLAAGAPDLTAGTMYAEAALNLHPWDWWNNDGSSRWPETDTAVAASALVLRYNPRHVGAAHIAIHALEASQRPDSALGPANVLTSLMRGSAHLNHMPSHIYHRVGQYAGSVQHNQDAVRLDSLYEVIRGAKWRYPMYYAHDNEFEWVSATFMGDSASARTAGRRLLGIVDPQLLLCYSNAQHFLTAPGLVAMRFGQWSVLDTLASPYPRYGLVYPRAMWHYTRGWALLRTGRIAQAEAARDSVFALAATLPTDSMVSNNRGSELLGIAGQILAGEILAAQRRYDLAADLLRDAVTRQDALNYDEPPPFFYPARHSLGAVLLEAFRADPTKVAYAREAQRVYRTDLGLMDGPSRYVINRNPQNGWSLRGMVLAAQLLHEDPTPWQTQFDRVWLKGAPVPPSSRY